MKKYAIQNKYVMILNWFKKIYNYSFSNKLGKYHIDYDELIKLSKEYLAYHISNVEIQVNDEKWIEIKKFADDDKKLYFRDRQSPHQFFKIIMHTFFEFEIEKGKNLRLKTRASHYSLGDYLNILKINGYEPTPQNLTNIIHSTLKRIIYDNELVTGPYVFERKYYNQLDYTYKLINKSIQSYSNGIDSLQVIYSTYYNLKDL